jgi:hypothetical protein
MKPNAKRLVSALLAMGLFVAAFVVFFELVQPTYGDLMTAKGKLVGEQMLLQNESTTISQVRSVMAAYAGQDDVAKSIGQLLPSGENIAGAVAQVYGLASADNIAIQSVSIAVSAPNKIVSAASGGSQNVLASGIDVQPTSTIALTITANGNYESFRNFLSGLETNARIFDVKQLSIQPASAAGSQKTQDSFTYLLTVNTYYQNQ